MQLLPPEEEAEEEEKGEEEEEGVGGTLIQQPYPSPQNPPEPGLGGWGDPPPTQVGWFGYLHHYLYHHRH